MNYKEKNIKNILHGFFLAVAMSVAEPSTILPLIVHHFSQSVILVGIFTSLLRGGAIIVQLFAAFYAQSYKIVMPYMRGVFFVRFLKIFLYWIEYNFRILYNIKMKPNSSKTIYLVDRSYLDLIFYNSDAISKNLFLNHSIKPTHLVYVTGESSIIYNRKKEGSKINHEKKVNFFDELYDKIDVQNKIQINSVNNLPEICTMNALKFIFNKN
jgi:hypothetical protein